jgi:hypothetical protein
MERQHRLGRFNAEARRLAEIRRGFFFSAFLRGSLRLCVDCSFQDEPKNSSRLTTKSTKNARKGVGAERVFTRLVIAPVCPNASFTLGSLCSLRLNCSV